MIDPRERVTPSSCPACGYKIDAAATLDDDMRPLPGDHCVCMACTCLLTFDEAGKLALVGDAEAYLAALDKTERDEVLELISRIRALRAIDPHWPGRRQKAT